jgi:cytochrome c553
MNKKALVLVTTVVFLATSFPLFGQSSQALLDKERAALTPSKNELREGRTLAESSCAGCHGLDGIAMDEARPHLAGQRTIYLYREMLAYQKGTRSDESMRRAVEFLSDEALLKAAIYYASLPPPVSPAQAEESNAALQQTEADPLEAVKAATAGCGGCHGAEGNSSVPGMPNLTAQHPDYFVNAMKAYQGEGIARSHSMMQTLAASLDDELLGKMGLYYALQQPKQTAAKGSGDAEAAHTAAEACGSCHGADGNAAAADMPTLAGQDATYLVKTMKDYQSGQRNHTPMVTAVAGLGDAEIENLAAFYAEHEPLSRKVRKPLTTADWLERCDRCHGTDGNSADPRYAALAGQNEKYLLRVLNAYAEGERSDSMMHAMTDPLSEADIQRIAAYYASRDARSVVYFQLPCNGGEESGSQR